MVENRVATNPNLVVESPISKICTQIEQNYGGRWQIDSFQYYSAEKKWGALVIRTTSKGVRQIAICEESNSNGKPSYHIIDPIYPDQKSNKPGKKNHRTKLIRQYRLKIDKLLEKPHSGIYT